MPPPSEIRKELAEIDKLVAKNGCIEKELVSGAVGGITATVGRCFNSNSAERFSGTNGNSNQGYNYFSKPFSTVRSFRTGLLGGSGFVAGVAGTTLGATGAAAITGFVACAAWHGAKRAYRLWRRRAARVVLADSDNLPPRLLDQQQLIEGCVRGVHSEEDILVPSDGEDEEQADNGAPQGNAPVDPPPGVNVPLPPAQPARQRRPRRTYVDPYKGDPHRLAPHRSFWIRLAAEARARWGRISRTPANVDIVYQWCFREAQRLTSRPDQPEGSIRKEHLSLYLRTVVESVFVISSEEEALDDLVKMLGKAGKIRGWEDKALGF